MLKNIFFLAVMVSIVVAGVALADGGFWGNITYKNCNCRDGAYPDKVKIWPATGGQYFLFGVTCRQGGGGYNTLSQTFPPGDYYLTVILSPLSNCEHAMVQMVHHDTTWQKVDLVVLGQTPEPYSGDE